MAKCEYFRYTLMKSMLVDFKLGFCMLNVHVNLDQIYSNLMFHRL